MSGRLTTTSYSILGLLAVRPWSAYELTKQVERSLRFCWPRAETRVYQEPKNLVDLGLAEATVEAVGHRRRTVYSITDAGRQALRSWLSEPSAPPRFEAEALLKLFFADQGDRADLIATLDQLQAHAEDRRAQAATQAAEYMAGGAAFPERVHILAVLGQFVADHNRLLAEWAAWARAEVETWPDTTAGAPPERTFATFRAEVARVLGPAGGVPEAD